MEVRLIFGRLRVVLNRRCPTMKRNLTQEYMDELGIYGGVPERRGDVILDLRDKCRGTQNGL